MQQQEQNWQNQQHGSNKSKYENALDFESEASNRRLSFRSWLSRRSEQGQSSQPRQEPLRASNEPLHDYSYRRGYPAQDYPTREEEEQFSVSSSSFGFTAATPLNEAGESWSTAASVPAGRRIYWGPGSVSSAAPGPEQPQDAPARAHVDPAWSQPPWWAQPQPQSSQGRLIAWILLALALLALLPGGVGLLLGLLGAALGLVIAVCVIGLFCVLPLAIGGVIVWLLVRSHQRGW
ncbi:hypothetical protein [Thermogemmatispora sp.]|uniref:hypothetical protein n=1 Tax=Thermogemmatispora sp. TaxID=1968838 RepID=UPI001DE59AE7|nr:hypothetical protein [Thermogemmatispora sp.]MBX5449405.1 hypothetical protein [Thermogemmatispora sp.]